MLEELVHRVEATLLGFGRSLFQGRQEAAEALPVAKIAPSAEPPDEELTRRRAELELFEAQATAVSQRLTENQESAALLPSQIESSLHRGKASQALVQALELERIRKDIDCAQDLLPRLEQVCWSIRYRIRQLERHLERDTTRKRKGSRGREDCLNKKRKRPHGPARSR